MRVLSLQAENFKRIRVVSIVPKGRVVEVSGDNEAGKTSCLDAIWTALAGKDTAPRKPIHTGADTAEIKLVLGDDEPQFIVRRRFQLKEGVPYATDLIVESGEGARFPSPQGMLNALLGRYTFDVLEFTKLKDPEQVAALRPFVTGVDFASIEGLNKRDFENRTDLNRKAKELRAQADGISLPSGAMPEPADVAALEAKLAEASARNSAVATAKAEFEALKNRLTEADAWIAEEERKLVQARERRAAIKLQMDECTQPGDPIDATQVQADLQAARAGNEIAARATNKLALNTRAEVIEAQAVDLTVAMAKRKADAAAAVAKAKMPVPGLGFAEDEDGKPYVTLNGEPFSQSSTAQKIKTSVAIAAAMNPKLRVARIADGSLLDKTSWAQLNDLADEHDLQVWVETIEPKSATAIVIEDGGVAGAPEIPSKPEPTAAVGEVI